VATWTYETTTVAPAEARRIWELWTDVAGWSRWHPGIASAMLDGAFARGATGHIRAPAGPQSPLRVIAVDPPHSFVTETTLRFTRLEFDHELEPDGAGGTRLTHRVRMTGPATPFFRRVLGPRFAERMPAALQGLAALAAET
jgi:uncharacterized protein YndB with AHSA1/START domain